MENSAYIKLLNKGPVLDIGCFTRCRLFEFDTSDFSPLVGMDFNPQTKSKIYTDWKKEFPNKPIKEFNDCFEVHEGAEGDVRDFHFEENTYSCIICIDVLHFFSPNQRDQIIQRMITALKPNGLLHLQLNRVGCPAITQNPAWIKINENEFYHSEKPEDKYFLWDNWEWEKLINEQMIIAEYSELDHPYFVNLLIQKG